MQSGTHTYMYRCCDLAWYGMESKGNQSRLEVFFFFWGGGGGGGGVDVPTISIVHFEALRFPRGSVIKPSLPYFLFLFFSRSL